MSKNKVLIIAVLEFFMLVSVILSIYILFNGKKTTDFLLIFLACMCLRNRIIADFMFDRWHTLKLKDRYEDEA